MKKIMVVHGLIYLIALDFVGCASFSEGKIPLISEGPTKYSDTPQMLVSDKRKYKHMTKQQMEEESELHSEAGSLWQMDGQNAYLFAQNTARHEGDALNIKLEGNGYKQVETKATVIQSLLTQIEEAEKAKNAPAQPLADDGKPKDRAPASAPAKKEDDKVNIADAQIVPAKLGERLPDGTYRVKGTQAFTIKNKDFKVIVTGLMRAEDFKDDGVGSNKLIDAQYDVVTLRKNNADETDSL